MTDGTANELITTIYDVHQKDIYQHKSAHLSHFDHNTNNFAKNIYHLELIIDFQNTYRILNINKNECSEYFKIVIGHL